MSLCKGSSVYNPDLVNIDNKNVHCPDIETCNAGPSSNIR